jgi:hypothetical protein
MGIPNPSTVAPESEREEEGRSWSRWGVPFVEELDVAAPLDPMSPAGLQARPPDGGTRRAGAAQEDRPWRIQEQHAFAVHRPWRSLKPPRRLTPTSPPGLHCYAAGPRRPPLPEAGGRRVQGSADEAMKPWTAPPCFCSRPFLCSSPRLLRRRVQERKVSLNPPSPCCGPGLRAEAGPSLVRSLYVCRLLSRIAPPRRPAVA